MSGLQAIQSIQHYYLAQLQRARDLHEIGRSEQQLLQRSSPGYSKADEILDGIIVELAPREQEEEMRDLVARCKAESQRFFQENCKAIFDGINEMDRLYNEEGSAVERGSSQEEAFQNELYTSLEECVRIRYQVLNGVYNKTCEKVSKCLGIINSPNASEVTKVYFSHKIKAIQGFQERLKDRVSSFIDVDKRVVWRNYRQLFLEACRRFLPSAKTPDPNDVKTVDQLTVAIEQTLDKTDVSLKVFLFYAIQNVDPLRERVNHVALNVLDELSREFSETAMKKGQQQLQCRRITVVTSEKTSE